MTYPQNPNFSVRLRTYHSPAQAVHSIFDYPARPIFYMLAILERIDTQSDRIDYLVELFAALRPRHPDDGTRATANVRTLCQLLMGNQQQVLALRNYMLRVLASRRHTSLYTDLGILSNDGFFSELRRRLSYRILPPALEDVYLSDALDQILYVKTDTRWISAVPASDWLALFDILALADRTAFDEGLASDNHIALAGMLDAIRTLSYRICAIGLEPKLIRIHPEIEKFESPFLMQNVEVNAYLDGYARLLNGDSSNNEDAKHLLVMLDQCDGVVAKIRKNALNQGTSIALTYLLVALTQSIERLRKLLFLVDVTGQLPNPVNVERAYDAYVAGLQNASAAPAISPRRAAAVTLGLELIEADNNKYAVQKLFADNIDLLARNVTEHASRTGEHYIAESRSVYGAMFLSSAGAGFIIGFMALLKILASYLRTAPLVEAFLYSLNYSFGFMLIHVLHFTVATKQPAMTASRIAAGLHSHDGRHIDLGSMSELIVKVLRTQLVSVLGNLALGIPVAYLIAVTYSALMGHHLVSPEKARHLLHDIDPVASLALFHAMIAGVCLFVAGLVSGYYDNKALYSRMAQRISQLRGLGRLLGQDRLHRLAQYIEDNLGGLMGNFYFGILLGTIGTLGDLLGLPIDIRHITFSAANFATALVGLDNQITWQVAVTSVVGILSIGTVNLLVSFGLALWVALRSRQVRFDHGILLLQILARRFWDGPADFFIAPRDVVETVDAENSANPD
jgi:site-specific recombinase